VSLSIAIESDSDASVSLSTAIERGQDTIRSAQDAPGYKQGFMELRH
jgi:hypothetical protein